MPTWDEVKQQEADIIVAEDEHRKALAAIVEESKPKQGGGCSICGNEPAVNVSGTYWLCGECVENKLNDCDSFKDRLFGLVEEWRNQAEYQREEKNHQYAAAQDDDADEIETIIKEVM